MAGQEPDVPALDGSRSADQVAALPEAELCTRDVDRSAEQSSAAQAPVGAGVASGLSDAFPDSRVLYWRPEPGLMARSQLEEQLHGVLLPQVELKVATQLLWDLLALAVLQEWLVSAWR